MGLSIKNAETERKIRVLAARRNQSLTTAVDQAVDEALEREGPSQAEVQARLQRYDAFLRDWDERLGPGPFPTDKEMDAWLYDEHGDPVG